MWLFNRALKIPHPNPPLALKIPHPNPPLAKGRELDFPASPQCIGGIKGGNSTCVYAVALYATSHNK
jgi:hypothetical protein